MSKEQINEMKKFMQISEGNEDINTCGVCNKKFRWVGNPEDTMCPECDAEYHDLGDDDTVEEGWFDDLGTGEEFARGEEEETCRCGRKDCKCGPVCDCEPVEEESKFSDKPHKYTYVYTDKQGNKTYIGVWYTEGNAIPKIRLWNEDRLPYSITNVMFMRDGSDQYLTDLFKEEVMNAFFDEETDEPRVADTQDVLDAVRDATRLGKAIMPVQNEAVEEGIGKSIKRGIKGWDKRDMGFGPSDPKGLRDRVRNMSDEQLDTLYDDTGKASPGSPQAFQQKVIRQEMKRRGITKDVEDNFMYDNPFESINLSNIVKDLLNEGPELGKSQLIKDYADENDFDYTDLSMSDDEEFGYPEADDEELSPRNVAWPKGVSVVDADDELEEDADDMDADNDGVIDDENIELDDLSINVDLEDF